MAIQTADNPRAEASRRSEDGNTASLVIDRTAAFRCSEPMLPPKAPGLRRFA
jgi:hypothetical protein